MRNKTKTLFRKRISMLFKDIMPLVVSVGVAIITYYTYVISTNQLKVARVAVEPHFYVTEQYSVDGDGVAKDHILKVFNVGAPVANISATVTSILDVNDYGEIRQRFIPISGYYRFIFWEGVPEGLIVSFKRNGDLAIIGELIGKSSSIEDYLEVNLTHAVFIAYQSYDGENIEKCFLGNKSIECEAVQAYRKGSINFVELSSLNHKKLMGIYRDTGKGSSKVP